MLENQRTAMPFCTRTRWFESPCLFYTLVRTFDPLLRGIDEREGPTRNILKHGNWAGSCPALLAQSPKQANLGRLMFSSSRANVSTNLEVSVEGWYDPVAL